MVVTTQKARSFLIWDRKGVDPDNREWGEEMGEVEGRETTIRIYYIRKEFLFIKRKNCSSPYLLKKERKIICLWLSCHSPHTAPPLPAPSGSSLTSVCIHCLSFFPHIQFLALSSVGKPEAHGLHRHWSNCSTLQLKRDTSIDSLEMTKFGCVLIKFFILKSCWLGRLDGWLGLGCLPIMRTVIPILAHPVHLCLHTFLIPLYSHIAYPLPNVLSLAFLFLITR